MKINVNMQGRGSQRCDARTATASRQRFILILIFPFTAYNVGGKPSTLILK